MNECIKNARNIFHNESLLKIDNLDRCNCKPACTSLAYDADTYYSPVDGLEHIYDRLDMEDEKMLVKQQFSNDIYLRMRLEFSLFVLIQMVHSK